MESGPGSLVLLRHGESVFNASSTFTGLLDVPLSEAGERQVGVAARLIADAALTPTLVVDTPMLRARRTRDLLLDALGVQPEVVTTWRLVERDYGCLTGVPKVEARQRHGDDAFFAWRRTMHGRPPAASDDQRSSWTKPAPVAGTGPLVPGCGESLADVVARVRPAWDELILPRLRRGECVAVVAHGNSLRALCAVIDGLADAEAEQLNIPAGHPLVYRLAEGRPEPRGGYYLDATSANEATAAVAAEGGT